jgi:uncharacterized protein YabN with tetrapyrrole methylase and pyrophosphatase domain
LFGALALEGTFGVASERSGNTPPVSDEHFSDPLHASWNIQSEASALGFDWPDISGVFAKVREEIEEIADAWRNGDREDAQRELGDVLFAIVNLARFLGTDPRKELHDANARFTERFKMLKTALHEQGLVMKECSLEQLDKVWERVKEEIDQSSKKGA